MRSAARNSRRNTRVRPQRKCRRAARASGAQARTTGIPARAAAVRPLASSRTGTCSQHCDVQPARCLAVVTNTSASASALGSGFSNVKRIFIRGVDGYGSQGGWYQAERKSWHYPAHDCKLQDRPKANVLQFCGYNSTTVSFTRSHVLLMRRSETELKPTDNGGCRVRVADFSTLTEAVDYAASSRAGFNFYSGRGELVEVLPYRDLRDRAVGLARRMLRGTLRGGDRVALVAETGSHFMRTFFACQYAGLIPVPVPPPVAFTGRAGYVGHIRSLLASATAAAVLSPASYLEMIREAAQPLGLKIVGTYDELDGLPEDGVDLPHVGQEHLSYLQFSSGSTRSPAGVAVTQRALLANLRGILQDALEVNAADRCTSWLPF